MRCQIHTLDAETTLTVLRSISSQFEELALVEQNDQTVVNGLFILTRISIGNFRPLSQFASFMEETGKELPVVPGLVEKAWGKRSLSNGYRLLPRLVGI